MKCSWRAKVHIFAFPNCNLVSNQFKNGPMKILSIPLLMLVSCLSLSSYAATEPTPEDYQAMSDALKSEKGLVAEVHGGDIEHGMFVLVWRDKKDFFKFVQLPLTGRNEEAKKILSQVH